MSDVLDPLAYLDEWISENWDPELTVGAWWERLGLAGWAAPILARESYGRGLSRGDAMRVHEALRAAGALGPPMGLGLSLAAPTIVTHGTREQVERYVRDIVTGQRGWCQLFSEPSAGSDLAGLSTRAERDGDVWIINGQKVWTSGGHFADFGMLLARTNPVAPKHQGITWFVLDMHQAGVEVRPLREMTGSTMFSEVFFTDAVVPDAARIGDQNDGWRVANTTLLFERSGMGAGSDAPARGTMMARAGTVANDLARRAGDFAPRPRPRRSRVDEGTTARSSVRPSPVAGFVDLAHQFHRSRDAVVRQGIVRLFTLRELARLNTERQKAMRTAGGEIAGLANFSKLAMGEIVRQQRDLAMAIMGPRGMLHAYDNDDRPVLANAPGGAPAAMMTYQALGAQALPIFGGTDQIQRNIIAERTLGLPKEPGDRSSTPFNELPRNG